jgi:hypothetical protein
MPETSKILFMNSSNNKKDSNLLLFINHLAEWILLISSQLYHAYNWSSVHNIYTLKLPFCFSF